MPSLAAVLDACTDDTLLRIATSLTTATDLLRLVLTSSASAQRFYFTATSYSGSSAGGSGGVPSSGASAAAADTWSIIEEAARLSLTKCTEQERGWVPRRGRESWLQLLHEVELLRRAAVFGRSHDSILLSEGGMRATLNPSDNSPHAAASKVTMRSGRHFAQFTLATGVRMLFGVIRPGWDVEAGRNAYRRWRHGHCFYVTYWGKCAGGHQSDAAGGSIVQSAADWDTDQSGLPVVRIPVEGDRIGLLLDLEQGSMTVYKNDQRLGVMVPSGLCGEFCWAVELHLVSGEPDGSARIEPGAAPPSPAAEELA
jgi:hypothetical protein